jgi:peptidyl-prolyl cis-trans isomerase C
MNWRALGKAALAEPLLHFLIGGLAVFLFFAFRGEEADPESRRITVTVAVAEQLAARFGQTMQRAPTPTEMDGLIRDHIREEVYYREAKRLGLDADDYVIRRRLRSKMEYLARTEAEAAIPDEATLQAWLKQNAARYATDATYSFDQIFLGSETTQEELLVEGLRAGQSWRSMSQPISLPQSVERSSRADIERQFGAQFVAALAKAKKGQWSKAIPSGFGYHLVRVRAAEAGTPPRLADIRQRVENDWRAATASRREAKAYQVLLDGYDIRIEKP